MVNIILKNSKWLTLVVLLFAAASCKKDKDEEPTPLPPSNPTGTLFMHLHNYVENNEVAAYQSVYTNDAGREFSFTLAQVYFSSFQLVKTDGSVVDVAGKIILKEQQTETYQLGKVPVGNYKSIRFRVGLAPDVNALEPSAVADSAALNRSEMWYDLTPQPGGYVFINVQGKVDTTTDASGTTAQMQDFVFKIGTDQSYIQVNMPDKPFTILEDAAEYGHIIIDYNVLFSGLQLNDPSNLLIQSAADNNSAFAQSLRNNIPSMFRYE